MKAKSGCYDGVFTFNKEELRSVLVYLFYPNKDELYYENFLKIQDAEVSVILALGKSDKWEIVYSHIP